jgi:hypothetical protein
MAKRSAPTKRSSACSSPHADIIVKGGREVEYGHKLNLTTGRSVLILDLVIEAGNPADSERFPPMLERHMAFYGEAPDRRPPTVVSVPQTPQAQYWMAARALEKIRDRLNRSRELNSGIAQTLREQPSAAVPSLPSLIGTDRAQEIDTSKRGPVDVREVEFAVGALPQQES